MADSRELFGSAFRFVLVGGLNTLVTGAALSLLAHVLPRTLAYTIVFAAGLALSTWLAGAFVFRVKMARWQTVAYVGMYIAVYLIGLAVVALSERVGLDPSWTGLVVLVTAPLTFIGARLILRPGQSTEDRDAAPSRGSVL